MFACILNDLLLCSSVISERRTSREQFLLAALQTLNGHTAKERVVFDALLPEVFTLVARAEVELHGVFVVALRREGCVREGEWRRRRIALRSPLAAV